MQERISTASTYLMQTEQLRYVAWVNDTGYICNHYMYEIPGSQKLPQESKRSKASGSQGQGQKSPSDFHHHEDVNHKVGDAQILHRDSSATIWCSSPLDPKKDSRKMQASHHFPPLNQLYFSREKKVDKRLELG